MSHATTQPVPIHGRDRPADAGLRRVAAFTVWPLVTGAFVLAYVWLAERTGVSGYLDSSGLLFLLSVGFLALWMLLERRLPYRPEWNHFGRQGTNDLLHYGAGIVLPEELVRIAIYAALPAVSEALPATQTVWPREAPLYVQVPLALALHELGEYAFHRLAHRVPWLWSLHRLHHTSERLTLTKGFRHNVVDRLINGAILGALMIGTGVPPETLIWVSAIYTATGVPAHANVDIRFPPFLNAVFISPPVHRIHHAVDPRHGNSNFGGVLMLWDVVFGTYIDSNKCTLDDLGVVNNTLPEGFWAQYWSFLHWKRLDADPVKQRGGL